MTATVILCKELQSILSFGQSALDGRLVRIACGSRKNCFTKFGYAGRLEFCEPVPVVFFALHVETIKRCFAGFWCVVHPEGWETMIVFVS